MLVFVLPLPPLHKKTINFLVSMAPGEARIWSAEVTGSKLGPTPHLSPLFTGIMLGRVVSEGCHTQFQAIPNPLGFLSTFQPRWENKQMGTWPPNPAKISSPTLLPLKLSLLLQI
jgi:hypothetical protein